MKSYFFKALLQNDGWLENAVVSVDDTGKIVSISQNNQCKSAHGYVIPAFQNAHSHAFQYAMAGLAEDKSGDDNFWSWRKEMYSLAMRLNPDEVKAIATMLYAELVRLGYSNVAEFHYLHHDKNGKPYNNLATMGEALIEAAKEVGIKITLIPVFYQKGGFGIEPTENQRRFISNNFDDYARLFEATVEACKKYDKANIAVGVHSLRGVITDDILRVVSDLPQNIPFHIHISEQLKEVEDCINFLGKRPVEWLLENVELNDRFHLVHSTHINVEETEKLARSKANVVICPSTEGNLADGIFPLREFQKLGGNWSIGTDSHIGLNPFEELRLLDYGQRLFTRQRKTFPENSGLFAIKNITLAGRKAMNNLNEEFFAVGEYFDACLISSTEPLLAGYNSERLSSSILYTTDASQILGTFVNGKLIQKDQNYQLIKERFLGLNLENPVRFFS